MYQSSACGSIRGVLLRGLRQSLGGVPLLALVCLVGCGSGAESTVKGTVTLDGVALDQGNVTFYPVNGAGSPAAGSITSGGQYTVGVGQTRGLPAGKYAAVVVARGPSTPHPLGGPPAPGKLLTPPKYSKEETSGLSFNVEPGSNVIDIEMTN